MKKNKKSAPVTPNAARAARHPRTPRPRRTPGGWRLRATRRAASGLPLSLPLALPCRGGWAGGPPFFFRKMINNNNEGGSLPPLRGLCPRNAPACIERCYHLRLGVLFFFRFLKFLLIGVTSPDSLFSLCYCLSVIRYLYRGLFQVDDITRPIALPMVKAMSRVIAISRVKAFSMMMIFPKNNVSMYVRYPEFPFLLSNYYLFIFSFI